MTDKFTWKPDDVVILPSKKGRKLTLKSFERFLQTETGKTLSPKTIARVRGLIASKQAKES